MFFLVLPPTALLELKLIVTLGCIIVGWEIGCYFFYQYYRLRDEKVQLNRVLLSYGIFLIGGFTCLLFINIETLFVTDDVLGEFIRKIGYFSVLVTPLLFWYITKVEQFEQMIPPKIQTFLIIKSFIPIIGVIIFSTTSRFFTLSIGVILLDGIFILLLQYKIIKISIASVRKRFIGIIVAEIFIMVATFLGAERIANLLELEMWLADTLFFIGLVFMFAGEVVMFFVLLNFPSIMEFKWKDVLLKLLIIQQETNQCLFSYDFVNLDEGEGTEVEEKYSSKEEKDKLISGGILGIDGITASITSSSDKIDKIHHGNTFIVLEHGTTNQKLNLTYALVIKEDVKTVKFFLKRIRHQFENFYKEILQNLESIQGHEEIFFTSFDIIIKNIL